MNKVVLAGFVLLIVIGCSDKQKEVKPKIIKTIKKKKIKKIDNNETKSKIKIDTNITKKNMMLIKEEFIPEHIRHSHIEVVEHY